MLINTPNKKRCRDQIENSDANKPVTPLKRKDTTHKSESEAKRHKNSGSEVFQVSMGIEKLEIPSNLSKKQDSRKFFDPAPAIELENTFNHRGFV